MEKLLNRQIKTEVGEDVTDFSWVKDELMRISEIGVGEALIKKARLDFWNKEKGFGFIYVDKDNNPVAKDSMDSQKVFIHASNVHGLQRGTFLTEIVIGYISRGQKGLELGFGNTIEDWERKHIEEIKSEKTKELELIFNKIHD